MARLHRLSVFSEDPARLAAIAKSPITEVNSSLRPSHLEATSAQIQFAGRPGQNRRAAHDGAIKITRN